MGAPNPDLARKAPSTSPLGARLQCDGYERGDLTSAFRNSVHASLPHQSCGCYLLVRFGFGWESVCSDERTFTYPTRSGWRELSRTPPRSWSRQPYHDRNRLDHWRGHLRDCWYGGGGTRRTRRPDLL